MVPLLNRQLFDVHQLTKKKEAIRWSLWKFVEAEVKAGWMSEPYTCNAVQGIPCQSSGHDCGVFILSYARCLVLDQKMLFSQVSKYATVFVHVLMHFCVMRCVLSV